MVADSDARRDGLHSVPLVLGYPRGESTLVFFHSKGDSQTRKWSPFLAVALPSVLNAHCVVHLRLPPLRFARRRLTTEFAALTAAPSSPVRSSIELATCDHCRWALADFAFFV